MGNEQETKLAMLAWKKHTMWIHGNNVVVENQDAINSITHKGESAFIKGEVGTST